MDTFIQGPSKRDVAGMKAAFALVEGAEVLSVLFKNARYGSFLVTGAAHLTVLDDLMVGGLNAAAAVKESKTKEGVTLRQRQPDSEVRAFPANFEGAFAPTPITADKVGHGDFVVASLNQAPYGDFVITGVATAAEDDDTYLMVGPWILSTENGLASRLNDVQLLATAGDHKIPVPPRRGHVEFKESA